MNDMPRRFQFSFQFDSDLDDVKDYLEANFDMADFTYRLWGRCARVWMFNYSDAMLTKLRFRDNGYTYMPV